MLDSTDSEALARLNEEVNERYKCQWQVEVTIVPDSPWLSVRLSPCEPVSIDIPPSLDYCIWRRTGDVFAVQRDGSVTDDPVIPANAHPR